MAVVSKSSFIRGMTRFPPYEATLGLVILDYRGSNDSFPKALLFYAEHEGDSPDSLTDSLT